MISLTLRILMTATATTKKNKLIDTENRLMVARGRGCEWEKWQNFFILKKIRA